MTSIRVLIMAGLILAGCSSSEKNARVEPGTFDQEYSTYARVLSNFVKGEYVDYLALKENRADLDAFVNELAGLTMKEYDRMDRDEQKAMWINAYNGLVLRSITDAYPVASAKEIDGAFDGKRWEVAGKKVTLGDIQNNILREDFEDPRVHFAINCGAAGCPPLANKPFLADALDEQLRESVTAFVNNPDRNKINPHINTVTTTEIFKWFPDDFKPEYDIEQFQNLEPSERATLSFIFAYADESIFEFVDESAEWSLEFMPFDWSLNDIKR